ncbi:LacI family DNA-binding transcriptional regulator [Arthrobacter flavus]|uniref:LacI family DNA-binding transcriptional regulator n=1 Tax=Arthrobacter flavus TaxID=95172 RepID=A0ABW4Q615_9MICC
MESGANKPAVTLNDVALAAGVSLATASRSLNGSARKVNDTYRLRVVDAAQRLGYIPNLFAQAVAKGATTTVALLVADISDPYFSTIASGVIQAAESAGLVVTIAVTGRNPERELATVRALRGQRPRVMILAGSRMAGSPQEADLRKELSAFEENGGRVAFISQNAAPFATVLLDNRGGARALAESLVELGYRCFAVVAGPPTIVTSQDRLQGFRDGLAAHGLDLAEHHIAHTDFTRDGGYQAATDLLQAGLDDVDLLFAVSDVMAMGAMSALRDAGLEPGRDLGVAGYDDIPTVRDITPSLTTVRIPLEEVGRRALELAFGVAQGQDGAGQGGSSTIPVVTEVVRRDSTPRR